MLYPPVYSSDMQRGHILILIAIIAATMLFDSWKVSIWAENLCNRLYKSLCPERKEETPMQDEQQYPSTETQDKTAPESEIFALSDKLRNLRQEKDDFTAMLKDINADIGAVERELSDAMTEAECPNFTRGDKQFILTTTTRWSAETECKEELYEKLKAKGYGHLFTVNTQTLGSFVREQVDETADDDGNTHVPDWLLGLVKSYDDVGITMKKAPKKSK